MNVYKKFWAAVTEKNDDGMVAYVIPFTTGDNALYILGRKDLIFANVFATKKAAEATANYWNECYRKNGTYMFQKGETA